MDDQRDYAEEAANQRDLEREGAEELAAERAEGGGRWTMPDWMEPYRDLICNTGGNPIEELVNDDSANARNNVIRAALIVAVTSQVSLLNQLHVKGLLGGEPR